MTDFIWSGPAVADLRALWIEERLSTAACADELMQRYGGVLSRSAVAGKCKRLGIQRGEERRAPRERREPRAPRRMLEARTRVAGPQPFVDRAPPVPSPAPVVAPEPLRIPFLVLEARHCRWPLGDPRAPDFACCGLDRPTVCLLGAEEFDPNCFYCRFHQRQGRRA